MQEQAVAWQSRKGVCAKIVDVIYLDALDCAPQTALSSLFKEKATIKRVIGGEREKALSGASKTTSAAASSAHAPGDELSKRISASAQLSCARQLLGSLQTSTLL